MNEIYLSVVIPFFCELDLIGRAVESVLINCDEQMKVEILVCNDGCVSELDIRSRLSDKANESVNVLSNNGPKGPGAARNVGLEAAKGNVIAFLDADDYWLPGKVFSQLAAVRRGANFVATSYRFNGGYTVVSPPSCIQKPIDVFLERGIGTSTVLITRDLLSAHRFKNIRFSQDIDFWYALSNSPIFQYCSIDSCCVEYSTGGSTKNKWVQLRYFYKVLCINDISRIARVRVIASYVVNGAFNHYVKRFLFG